MAWGYMHKLGPSAEERQLSRKEETAMRYTKPSIAALGSASEAIQQFGNKSQPNFADAGGSDLNWSTGHSYDLDE